MGYVRRAFTCLISSTTTSAARRLLRCSLYKKTMSTPKNGGVAKKLILTIRAIMIGQQIDLVAGDFNGTAWRCSTRDNSSTIDEAFADSVLPTPLGLTPLWGPGSILNNWADVCEFLKPPDSDRYWKVRMHGAFSIPRKTPGLRPTDQSCHHETRLHLDFVGWRNSNHITKNLTDEFHSKSVLHRTKKVRPSRKSASAIS